MGTTAHLTILEKVDRVEHFDADGGGQIVRTFYCEPYTAHKTLLTALKGTVRAKVGGEAGEYERVKPHNDPLYPNFYCTDAKVVPFAPEAVRGAKPTGFNNANSDQIAACKTALDQIDDFDFSNCPDISPASSVLIGGTDITTSTVSVNGLPESNGKCGAFVTATYNPLIFMKGLSSSQDPFDFVDPQWTPVTKVTQMGRDLQFIAPVPLSNAAPDYAGGVSDTAVIPEIIWEFTVKRLMVPFLPKNVITLLSNKINKQVIHWGELTFYEGIVRMETPDIQLCTAPDGATYYNLTLKFSIRNLYDVYYSPATVNTVAGYRKGWVSWNHMLGIPTRLKIKSARFGYYPVGWDDGIFQYFGTFRGMHLFDTDMQTSVGWPNGHLASLDSDGGIFTAGFKAGQ